MIAAPHRRNLTMGAQYLAVLAAASLVGCIPSSADRDASNDVPPDTQSAGTNDNRAKTHPDVSGRERTGTASFYAERFTGQTMADGTPMDPQDDNAASKTLPLGTTAKVTNVETGKSANVTIQDRGPYVQGRIIDLSPATAREIGLDREDGVTTVVVAPIEVPLPDGGVKRGAAAPR